MSPAWARTMATSHLSDGTRMYLRPSSSMICLPSSATVPMPVGVRKPPRPAPPQRIISASVPCGVGSTSRRPSFIALPISGVVPMWLATTFLILPCLTSSTTPRSR